MGAEKSRYRELQGGLNYIYPPVHAIQDNIPCLYKSLEYPQNFSINEILDDYFSKKQEEISVRDKKNKLSSIVSQKLKKVNGSIGKINSLLKKRDNTEKYKLYGELSSAGSGSFHN